MSQPSVIELAYQTNLQSQYQKFLDWPGFVLLESTDHGLGRYDILSACPYDSLIIKQKEQNLPVILNTIKQQLTTTVGNYDLPFQGGALGYISYDLGAKLMGIESPTQPEWASMPLFNLGLYDWAIIADHYLKKVILFAANTQTSTKQFIEEVISTWQSPISTQKDCVLSEAFSPLMDYETYKNAFRNIQEALHTGRSYQVNLTQAFKTNFNGDPWAVYQKISSKNPVPYSAFLRTEESDILSFSPERFLLQENGRLLTSPIKGTIGRSADAVQDNLLKEQLSDSAKNRAENVMIVDLMRNDLSRIAQAGTVRVTDLCSIQSFKSVHHLVSHIEAQAKPSLHPLDLFLSCFPGGSITGAPKLEAMRIIAEQEPYQRGIYCGSILYFSRHGRFDSNIAIRTLKAKEGLLHLAAGGGLVIDSECEDEYMECFIKIKSIVHSLTEI